MPMAYNGSLATAGVLTTSATPNTETEAFFLKAGVRNAALTSVRVGGRAAAATTISGIEYRMIKWGTASTAGTGITPTPADPGMQAAKATAASAPTAGTTRTNHVIFFSGKAGPGGWNAETPDAKMLLEGSSALSIDMLAASSEASLTYGFNFSFEE